MIIYPEPISLELYGKKIFVGHGDGLGPGDKGYKVIKRILRNPLCQWAFARLHPNFGIGLASFFSGKSRKSQNDDHTFLGKDREWLYQYSQKQQEQNPHDYYIFGHRHLPLKMKISGGVYYNLGEWINDQTFLKIDSSQPIFLRWNGQASEPYEPQYDGTI